MRIHFKISKNTEIVPFNYQHFLIGTFHNWIGWNILHDSISLYSLSWLRGSKITSDGFNFPNGAEWFISFWDNSIGKQVINGAKRNPEICCGLTVEEIIIQETPRFGNREKFSVASPILVRKYDKDKAIHLTYNDAEADYYLTETLKRKLKIANLQTEVSVFFDRTYPNAKTKLVDIKGIKSRANFCPIIIEGTPEVIQFAWNVGIGHSTGSGFGAIF